MGPALTFHWFIVASDPGTDIIIGDDFFSRVFAWIRYPERTVWIDDEEVPTFTEDKFYADPVLYYQALPRMIGMEGYSDKPLQVYYDKDRRYES